MEKSKVYFTNFRTKPGKNILDKLRNLLISAGIKNIDFKEKFVAIKIHFGEPGNIAYLRPNYAKVVVSLIKELGGKPFLTDSNTLYTGRRSNAIDHLESAEENGFNKITTGCNIIIADGLKGTEYKEIEINKKYCKTAKIGAAIADADIIISMSHFKGHEMTGFGGALKNLGMGSGSRAGKFEMHSASKPKINKENCVGCGMCIKSCAQHAISFDENRKADIDQNKCAGCGQCVAVCQHDGAKMYESGITATEKISEYAYAVVKDKPNFHISFIMDVSPDCDCFDNNDLPIVPNIGIAASFDPVALDRACIDMVNKAPVIKGSILDEVNYKEGEDKFECIHEGTDWEAGLRHGVEIGLGNEEYEIINVK